MLAFSLSRLRSVLRNAVFLAVGCWGTRRSSRGPHRSESRAVNLVASEVDPVNLAGVGNLVKWVRMEQWLVAAAQLRPLARALRTQASADPNALNAVLSAVAVWRGYRQHDHAALHADSVYRTEGFCYH